MAGYKEHISVSGLLGVCYGLTSTFVLGFTPVQGALAGVLTWVAGMLPDLDSETGKPVREIFGLVASIAPLLMIRHLIRWGGDVETTILLAIIVWATIRYGASSLLGRFVVHRGMFHSIPAMLIAAEATFLAYKSESNQVKLLMASGVALGFLSHLILDEVYSVQWTGVRLKLNKAAGSAFKLFGKALAPNAMAYGLLAVLTYATLISAGLIDDPYTRPSSDLLRQAMEAPSKLPQWR